MDFIVAVIGFLLRVLDALLAPFYWLRTRRHRQVPAITDERLRLSVVDIAERIRSGELSSETITSAYIARIREVNPLINAVVEERFAAALAEARQVDADLIEARRSGKLGSLVDGKPLLGVPFTVKESCQLTGLSNAVGCLEHARRKAATDGTAVAAVRRAGGVPLLVSNTPELCLGWDTANLLNGTTRNPHCLARSAGGSSGGEAALISCGASPFGVASDIAGSVRLPAAYCGVFGHKPTPGVISIEGHVPTLQDEKFAEFLTVGPIARHAADLPLLLDVMAGPNAKLLRLNEPVDLRKIKVYYMTEVTTSIGLIDVDKQIKELVVSAARHLHDKCGCELSEEKFTEFDHALEMSVSEFFSMKDLPNMLQDPNDPKVERNLFAEAVRVWCGGGARSAQALLFTLAARTRLMLTRGARARHRARLAALRRRLQEVLSDGVLLLPAAISAAPAVGRHTRASGAAYSMLANVLRLPATAVPVARPHTPAALQVISAPYQDRLCVAVARELERRFGGWAAPQ